MIAWLRIGSLQIANSAPSLAGLFVFGLSWSPNALFERGHQPHRLLILLQEIVEGFIGEFLKACSLPTCDSLNRLPRFVLKLNTLPWHEAAQHPSPFVESEVPGLTSCFADRLAANKTG